MGNACSQRCPVFKELYGGWAGKSRRPSPKIIRATYKKMWWYSMALPGPMQNPTQPGLVSAMAMITPPRDWSPLKALTISKWH